MQQRSDSPCRPVPRAVAAILCLGLLAAPGGGIFAASPGAVSITFPEVEKTTRIQRFRNQTFRALAPVDGDWAALSSSNWPADATFVLPATTRIIGIEFADGMPPADVDAILADCSQKALVAQARPERYDFELWVWLQDVDADLSERGVDWLDITLREGDYRLGCSLARVD